MAMLHPPTVHQSGLGAVGQSAYPAAAFAGTIGNGRLPLTPGASGLVCELEDSCREGRLDKALVALLPIDQQGSVLPVHLYKSLLHMCVKKKSLAGAKQLHAHLAKHGLEVKISLGELLVTTLVSCGSLADGLHLFHRLPNRTVFSWTAIVSGFTNAGQCREALTFYQQMLQEGVQPDKYTFVSLLKACSKLEDLEEGKRIHADARRHGFESDVFVGSTLVSMYAKCKSILSAQQVFDALSHRDVVSWNAMVAAYAQQNQGEKGLQIYSQMQEEGVSPDARTFVSALQACGSLADREESALVCGQKVRVESLRKGRQLHAEAVRRGVDSDVFVRNTLVNMYAKCGSVEDAQNIFDRLTERNVVSWNGMLAAYAQQGQGERVLQTYRQMQQLGLRPDARTFLRALQACGIIADTEEAVLLDGHNVKVESLRKGKEIHAAAVKMGFESDGFVGSTLVCMYAKCGSIMNAQQVFDKMSQVDVVSWNALLAAYVQGNSGEVGLQIFAQMQGKGVRPDARTIASALQACAILAGQEELAVVDGRNIKVKSLQKGKEIHGQAVKSGCESDLFVGSTLVSMYGKCGSIMDAQQVFDGLSQRDVVSWTAILAAYAQQNEGEMAWRIFEQMQEQGVRPDARTLVSALQACGAIAEKEPSVSEQERHVKAESLTKGKGLHALAVSMGFESDVFVGSSLVSMYAKCGSITDARQVFDTLSEKDVVSWTAMLGAYVQQGQGGMGLQIYHQMQEEGVLPDAQTYVNALQACAILAEEERSVPVDGQNVKEVAMVKGKKIHADAAARGFEGDIFVGNALVSMYAMCGSIQDAQRVFYSLLHRNVVSWNAMLTAHIQQDQGEKALQIYAEMQADGTKPDEVTFLSVLEACSRTGALDMCSDIHQSILEGGLESDPYVANSLIHAYSKCGSMVDAQRVFGTLPHHDLVSWNAMIAGYARLGLWETSVKCYERLCLSGMRPDSVTFLALLSACSHACRVDEGLEYFESMSRDYGISVQLEHYSCVIDLVGRAGLFCKAEDLLRRMPVEPDLAVWLCLLGACQKHGNAVLGRRAFDRAVELNPQEAAAYVLMLNIYADAGMWNSAREIDELRQRAGAWKKSPGQSWIEHNHEVHTFLVGDRRHEQGVRLLEFLKQLSWKLTQAGDLVTFNNKECSRQQDS